METPSNPVHQIQQLFARLQTLGVGRRAPLKSLGLSLPQLAILLSVRQAPGLRINELAQQLGVSTPTVSVSLRKLEQDGWVRREADPTDKRSSHLYLTLKAKAFAKRAESFQRKQTARFLSGLEPQEQAQLVRLLDKAISGLEAKNNDKSRLKPAKE
jgi:DNA-binding MarR family transcriptional regulator